MTNLEIFNCSENELTELNVSDCVLRSFYIYDNLFIKLEIPQIFEPLKEYTFLPGKKYDIYIIGIIKKLRRVIDDIHPIKKEIIGSVESDYINIKEKIKIKDHITDILIDYIQLVGILENFKKDKVISNIRIDRIEKERNKTLLEIIKTKIFGTSEIPPNNIIIDNYSFYTHFNEIIDCPLIVKKMALKINLLMLLVKADYTPKEINRLFSLSINDLKKNIGKKCRKILL